jgi:hypothetical protein
MLNRKWFDKLGFFNKGTLTTAQEVVVKPQSLLKHNIEVRHISNPYLSLKPITYTQSFYPSGVGRYSEWDSPVWGKAGSPVTTDHWYYLNDSPPDDLLTYVYATFPHSGKRELYTIQSPNIDATSTVNSVTFHLRLKLTTDGAHSGGFYWSFYDGNADWTSTVQSTSVAYNWKNFSITYTTNPRTGVAWTYAEINALQIGLTSYVEANATIAVTQAYIDVNYTTVSTVSDDNYLPFLNIERVKKRMDIGTATVEFPNSWVTTKNGNKVLLRDLLNKFDVIEIYRDKVVDFSGFILGLEYDLETITVILSSQVWQLTQQNTGIFNMTGKAEDIFSSLLNGYYYPIIDNFTGLLSWTISGTGTGNIDGERLVLTDQIVATSPVIDIDWSNSELEFDYSWNLDKKSSSSLLVVFGETEAPNGGWYLVFDFEFNKIYLTVPDYVSGPYLLTYSRTFQTIGSAHVKIVKNGKSTSLYIDGNLIKTLTTMEYTTDRTSVVFHPNTSPNSYNYIDNVSLKAKRPIASLIDSEKYGKNINCTASYETLLGAINNRLCYTMPSADSLASHWEWEEVYIPFDAAAFSASHPVGLPLFGMNFKSRVGENKSIILKIKDRNISNIKSTQTFDNFKTNLIALGAGTTDINGVGQPVAEVFNMIQYASVGMILNTLYQMSDESDQARLAQTANLLLGSRNASLENIEVDPLDYETSGLQVGDAYRIDVEEVMTDPNIYYRIEQETRKYSPDGAEIVLVSFNTQRRSMMKELALNLRAGLNKARYPQGGYVSQTYPKLTEVVTAGSTTTLNSAINFNTELYKGVKKVSWNMAISSPTATWQLWIDGVDQTESVFGATPNIGGCTNLDLTPWMGDVSNHTLVVKNTSVGSATISTWLDCILALA